ncbi:MAG: hypothetical protein M1814_003741 [Vezdaea aestivalis]|nr:MAG: hypothetical protein M1814_003741 [Vezdaea aestivalis]
MSGAVSSMQYGLSLPSPSSPTAGRRTYWQEALIDHCRNTRMTPPVFNIVSDRRGGRTAWSSSVTIGAQQIPARFWYDGQNVDNAKEDAAEVALQQLGVQSPTPSARQPWSGPN